MKRAISEGRALGARYVLHALEGRVVAIETRGPDEGAPRRTASGRTGRPLHVRIVDAEGEEHAIELPGAFALTEEGAAWTVLGITRGRDDAPRWIAVRDSATGRSWTDEESLADSFFPSVSCGAIALLSILAALFVVAFAEEVAGHELAGFYDRFLAFVIGCFGIVLLLNVAHIPGAILGRMRVGALRGDPEYRRLVPEPHID